MEVILNSDTIFLRVSKNFHTQKSLMYYVIHVKTGKEQEAIDDITKYKSHESDFDIFSPFRKELRKYKGEFREVLVRCFPGYAQSFAASGRVTNPMRRRKTAHQKHNAVSSAPMVQMPSTPAMANGISRSKKRRGEDSINEV